MKTFERNSIKAFVVSVIVYLACKIYMAIQILNTGLEDIPGAQKGLNEVGKGGNIFVIITSIILTIIFILLTYFICKSIFNNINKDNPRMLERFKGIYFANMTVLYIFSIILSLLSNYFPEVTWIKIVITGIIRILIAVGFNLLLLDKDEDPEIRTAPNIILFAVVFLF